LDGKGRKGGLGSTRFMVQALVTPSVAEKIGTEAGPVDEVDDA